MNATSAVDRPQVIGSADRLILAALWLAWAALLFGGAVGGTLNESQSNQIPTSCRMGSSAVLVAAGWFMAARLPRSPLGRLVAGLIAAGMTLGFVGDLFNADLIPLGLPNPVLGAIATFALGHVAYMTAIVCTARAAGLIRRGHWLWGVAVWQLVGLVGWAIVVLPAEENRELIGPALPYSLLLAGTAGCATAAALGDRRLVPLAAGGGLFLLSDLILAFRLFRGSFYRAGDAVWLTYGPGQMLIVFSIPVLVALVAASVARADRTSPAADPQPLPGR